jgi:asparagine synthase (glutamine-hydrolysing)
MSEICGDIGSQADVGPVAETLVWSDTQTAATYDGDSVSVHASVHPLLAESPVRDVGDDTRLWLVGDVYGIREGDRYSARPAEMDCVEYCVQCYRKHGVDCFSKLNGSFVGVVYDESDETVHVATDRLGTKAVFRARPESDRFLFSTDIQSLARHPGFETAFDRPYLYEYLAYKRSFGVTTPLQGVEKLPPATVTTVDLDSMSVEQSRYWEPIFDPLDRPFSYFVDRFTRTLQTVLDEWVRDDVNYGVMLSGGSDSRLVLAALNGDATAFHLNDWLNREARTTTRVAARADARFELLKRGRDHQQAALARNAPLSNFDGWFSQARTTGFADALTDEVDALLSGMYADTLFKDHGIPSPDVSLGSLGTLHLSVEDPIETVDEFVRRTAVELPAYVDDSVSMREILDANVRYDGDRIDHHGITYNSIRELVLCGEYYPLSNDTEQILTRSSSQMMPYRSPFLDNRLVDLHLQMPLKYRLRRNVVHRALERLAPDLAELPHGESRVPLDYPHYGYSFAEKTVALWKRHFESDWSPESHFTQGPWTDIEEFLRSGDFVEETLADNERLLDQFPFLDCDGVETCYRDHLDGANNTNELYTLMTFLELPVTEHVATDRGETDHGATDRGETDRDATDRRSES